MAVRLSAIRLVTGSRGLERPAQKAMNKRLLLKMGNRPTLNTRNLSAPVLYQIFTTSTDFQRKSAGLYRNEFSQKVEQFVMKLQENYILTKLNFPESFAAKFHRNPSSGFDNKIYLQRAEETPQPHYAFMYVIRASKAHEKSCQK
jgi:hypothetical protein